MQGLELENNILNGTVIISAVVLTTLKLYFNLEIVKNQSEKVNHWFTLIRSFFKSIKL